MFSAFNDLRLSQSQETDITSNDLLLQGTVLCAAHHSAYIQEDERNLRLVPILLGLALLVAGAT